MLTNRGLGTKAKKSLHEGVIIVPTAVNVAEALVREVQREVLREGK